MNFTQMLSSLRECIAKPVFKSTSDNDGTQRLPTLAELHDEKVFWKIYSSSLGGRSGHHESKRGNYLNLQPARDSIFSNGTNGKLSESAIKDSENFWKYSLNQTTSYVLFIQVANLTFLIVMAVVVSVKHDIVTSESLESAYRLILADLIVWALLSLVTIIALVIMRYYQDYLREVAGEGSGTVFETWKKVGQFILLLRILIVAINLSLRATNSYDNCYIEGPGYYDNTFQINLVLACICSVETMVFSTLPFPFPWAIIFCLVELIGHQGFRYFSCSDVLFNNGKHISFVSIGALLAFIALYSIAGLNTSVILLSSKNFFYNTKRLDSAAAEKRRFLDLLCTEIRSPLQHVVRIKFI